MTITVAGNNTFATRQRVFELINKFITKYGELSLERFDGEENNSAAIIEGLQSLSFLSPKKMVVIRNGGANKQLSEQIEQIISSIHDHTDVIFYEPSIDRRSSYFKVLKSKTEFEEFNELDGGGLARWLANLAKEKGGSLTFADANYMVERLGTDQNLLANELEKLLLYNPQINRDSIELLTEQTPQSKVFELLDAAFSGQKQRALRLYEDQRAQKVEPAAILAMVAWQLQQIAIAKQAGSRPLTEVVRDSGMKEYPLRKAKGLADKLSDEKLKAMVNEALDIDWRSKTSALDMDEALKNYITTL